jgi:hypothetical protein
MSPAERAAQRNPSCGLSACLARKGSHRPTLILPRIFSPAAVVSALPVACVGGPLTGLMYLLIARSNRARAATI